MMMTSLVLLRKRKHHEIEAYGWNFRNEPALAAKKACVEAGVLGSVKDHCKKNPFLAKAMFDRLYDLCKRK